MSNEYILISNQQRWEEMRDKMEAEQRARIEAEGPENREFYRQIQEIFTDGTLGEYIEDINYEFYLIIINSYMEAADGNKEYSPPAFYEIMMEVFQTYESKFTEYEYMVRMENPDEREFHAMDDGKRMETLHEEFDYNYSYESGMTDESACDVLRDLKLCFSDEDEMIGEHEDTYLANDPQNYLFSFPQQSKRRY